MEKAISQFRLMLQRRRFMKEFITGSAGAAFALSTSKELLANPLLQTSTINHVDSIINNAKQSSFNSTIRNDFLHYANLVNEVIATDPSASTTVQAIQAWIRQSVLYTPRDPNANQSITALRLPKDLSDMIIAPFLASLRLIDLSRNTTSPKIINIDSVKETLSSPMRILDHIEPNFYSNLYNRLNTEKTKNATLNNKLNLATDIFQGSLEELPTLIGKKQTPKDNFIKPVSFNATPLGCNCDYIDSNGNVHQIDCAPCIGIIVIVVIIIIVAK